MYSNLSMIIIMPAQQTSTRWILVYVPVASTECVHA